MQFVLKTGSAGYHKDYHLLKKVLGHGLVTSDGEFWKRQRRLIQPAFKRRRIASMCDLMVDRVESALDGWAPRADAGQPFNLMNEAAKLTLDIAVRTMFSSDIGDAAPMVGDNLQVCLQELDRRIWQPIAVPDWIPTARNRALKTAVRNLDSLVYPMIDARRTADDPGDDLLGMLLSAVDETTGETMTDLQVRDEVLTMFVAGHETSAATIAWTWHLLGQNPDAVEKLTTEVDAVLGARRPTLADLDAMPFNRAVIEEALRLYPPAWAVFRAALSDHQLGGVHISTGDMLLMPIYWIHRHPDFWDDPDAFQPERFIDREASHPFAYLPFGGGPRICIGNHFAMVELQFAIAMMARRYHIQPVPGQHIVPLPAITMRPRDGLTVTAQRREQRGNPRE